jgi:hypothetical protein
MKTKIWMVGALLGVVGCGGSPGPLEGAWQLEMLSGAAPITVEFRHGETEALGLIDKVSYERNGNDVLVTYEGGISKGTTVRYTMTSPDTARSELGTLRRMRE